MNMKEQGVAQAPPPWWIIVGLFVAVFAAITLLSAVLSLLVYDHLIASDHGLATLLLEKGPHKIMRRFMMLGVLVFIPSFLRLIRWGGFGDIGWTRVETLDGGASRRKQCGLGLLMGFVTLGSVVALMYGAGHRVMDASAWTPGVLVEMSLYVLVALLIALVEETAVRGILYRALARLWGAWPTALATSLLFAWVHFLKADPSAFEGVGVWDRTGAVIVSMFDGPARTVAFWPRFLSLTTMGCALCVVVHRTGTVWWAVGLHAAWVWIKKVNGALGDTADGMTAGTWLGVRSDATDGYLTVLLLLLLAVGLSRALRQPPTMIDAQSDEG